MDNLQRFLDAQKEDYFIALREMKEGAKLTHWMWYVFPVLKGQGRSGMAKLYGLNGREEAKAFLAHPVLGKRLLEITEVVLTHPDRSIRSIMRTSVDTWKFKACMTLFDILSPNDVFAKALDMFFNGQRDRKTQMMLDPQAYSTQKNQTTENN